MKICPHCYHDEFVAKIKIDGNQKVSGEPYEYKCVNCGFVFENYESLKTKPVSVFISLPMAGKTEDEINAEMEMIRKEAPGKIGKAPNEVKFIDSYVPGFKPKGGNVSLKYLAKSLELLADADYAYFAKGWETARGCRIEHEAAGKYGIRIIEAAPKKNELLIRFSELASIRFKTGKVSARESVDDLLSSLYEIGVDISDTGNWQIDFRNV